MDKKIKVEVNVEEVGSYIASAQESLNKVLEQIEDGSGIQSKSFSILMMAYGSATSAQNILAACNSILMRQTDDIKETIWDEFKDATVLLQAASQMVETAAAQLGFDDAIDFRDARVEGIEEDHYRELLSDFRQFEQFHKVSNSEDDLN